MNRGILIFAAIAVFGAAPLTAHGWHEGHRGTSVSISSDGDIETCGQLRVRFDGREASRAEEQMTLPPSTDALRHLRMPSNSGIWVRGTDRSDYQVRICKAAASSETLARISASAPGGRFSIQGPEGEDWIAYLLVEVPRNADVDLEAHTGPISVSRLSGELRARTTNGPLSFRETTGVVDAEAENGPISFKDCSGEVRASAYNGPISISGSGGRFHVDTQNGPISVSLRGLEWERGELDARAVNGPLTLRIPEGYRSGTVVESSGHSPVECRARGCQSARKTWDDELRRIEFGDSTPVIRLSTVNGPVSVRSEED